MHFLSLARVGREKLQRLVLRGGGFYTSRVNSASLEGDTERRAIRVGADPLACQNCHLQAGTQAYAMPLIDGARCDPADENPKQSARTWLRNLRGDRPRYQTNCSADVLGASASSTLINTPDQSVRLMA
jgi:hypothetical protein